MTRSRLLGTNPRILFRLFPGRERCHGNGPTTSLINASLAFQPFADGCIAGLGPCVVSSRTTLPAHLGQTFPVLYVLIRLLAAIFRVQCNALLIFENIHLHAFVSEHLLVA